MTSSTPRLAVIDVGSNSIKVLVAERDATGVLRAVFFHTIEARISKGISSTEPRLSEEGINKGVAAVQELLQEARKHGAADIQVVATSAVRDALNGAQFAATISATTGLPLRILTGEEEARLIGRGLTCDPALLDLQDFYVIDLGGGSLEILSYRQRSLTQAISLPLGCVRLTEKFVQDPSLPFSAADLEAIRQHSQTLLRSSGFAFGLPPSAVGIGTGGTVTTARSVFAARQGKELDQVDSLVTVEQLRELLATTARASLADRVRLPGMPAKRADVFPTALATLLAVTEVAGLISLRNSIYNLRWGVIAEQFDELQR